MTILIPFLLQLFVELFVGMVRSLELKLVMMGQIMLLGVMRHVQVHDLDGVVLLEVQHLPLFVQLNVEMARL